MNKLKRFNIGISPIIAIVIIIIVGIIVSGGVLTYIYLWYPVEPRTVKTEQNETKDWKDYKDKEFNIEAKYPQEYILNSNISGCIFDDELKNVNFVTHRTGNSETYETTTAITICVMSETKDLFLEEFWNGIGLNSINKEKGDINLGIEKANKGMQDLLVYNEYKEENTQVYSFGSSDGGRFLYSTVYFLENSPFIYSIELTLPIRNNDLGNIDPRDPDAKYINTYNKLLSTFKFNKNEK
jgi:hypothetical protein